MKLGNGLVKSFYFRFDRQVWQSEIYVQNRDLTISMHVCMYVVGGSGLFLCGLSDADRGHKIDSIPVWSGLSARDAGMASKSVIEVMRQQVAILTATPS